MFVVVCVLVYSLVLDVEKQLSETETQKVIEYGDKTTTNNFKLSRVDVNTEYLLIRVKFYS